MCDKCKNKNCNGCSVSILNGESSIIPEPICVQNCGSIVGCSEPIFSNCVIWTGGTLPCTNIFTNDTLTTALGKIDARICAIAPPSGVNCNIYASCTDPCPSSLVNKILSNTLDVSLATNGITNCQQVEIEDKQWLFSIPLLQNGFTTPVSFPSPLNLIVPTPTPSSVRYAVRIGYPTTTDLLEVRFHGETLTPFFSPSIGLINKVLFQILPLSKAPITPKYFIGIAVPLTANGFPIPYSILINTDGKVIINASSPLYSVDTNVQIVIPFDGLNYIKN